MQTLQNDFTLTKIMSLSTITITVALLAAFSSGAALAQDKYGKNFEERKTKVLKDVEMWQQAFEELRLCVQAATDRDAMKACREKMKANRDEVEKRRKGKKRY